MAKASRNFPKPTGGSWLPKESEPRGSFNPDLDDSGDFGDSQNTDQAHINIEFEKGRQSREKGLFEESAQHFSVVLAAEGIPAKMRFAALKQIVHVSLSQAERGDDRDKKIAYIQKAHGFIEEMDTVGLVDESASSKLVRALQFSKAVIIYQGLLEDNEDKKVLLRNGYKRLISVNEEVDSLGNENLHFKLHTNIHGIARMMTELTKDTSERDQWIRAWVEEGRNVLSLVKSYPHLTTEKTMLFYWDSYAHSLTYLSSIENDPVLKKQHQIDSYNAFMELLAIKRELTTQDSFHVVNKMELAGSMAIQVAASSSDAIEKSTWLKKSFDTKVKAIEFLTEAGLGESPRALSFYGTAARMINEIIKYVPIEEQEEWLEKKKDLETSLTRVNEKNARSTDVFVRKEQN